MHLNHPQTIPSPALWSVDKLSSMKPVPGVKKIGNHGSTMYLEQCLIHRNYQ